jgi:drug/metabolite transporter (DMT)-like permease
MLVGHTGLNYALRHVPAWGVGAAALGEPIGAIAIAWLLPAIAERPGPIALLGGACCLAGIVLTLMSAPRPAPR